MSERESASASSGDEQSQTNQPRAARSSSERDEKSGGRSSSHRRRHQQNQPRGESSQTKATINMNELREVIGLVSERGFTDFEFENADIRIRLRREQLAPTPSPQTHHATPVMQTQSAPATPAQTEEASKPEDELETIVAPIVGTFYRSPSPTSEPFIRTGERVEFETTVCIIEAMKLMNEIQAETSGVIEKIYVENGQPVEFGQPLFGVRKN